jgi:aminoglycoside phosphotransferase (APT) family kinase protein
MMLSSTFNGYREVLMLDKNKLIGIGRNSEVYEWEDGKVIKLLMGQAPQEWADIEARIGHDVQIAGLPVPYFGEIVEIDGRRGFVMEHIKGRSMLEALGKQPWQVVGLARLLARLHVEVHTCPAPADWIDQRGWLKGDIENNELIPEELKKQLFEVLKRLPEGDRICHGDFHPGNIMMTARGPIIIDWLGATRGHPMSDMARSVVVLSIGQPPPETPGRWLIEIIRKTLLSTYINTYFAQLSKGARQQFWAWRGVNAAAFLKHSVPEERPTLFEMIRQGIAAG